MDQFEALAEFLTLQEISTWFGILAHSFVSPFGVIILCTVLALAGAWTYRQLKRELIPLYEELGLLCKKLERIDGEEGFAAEIDVIGEQAEKTRLMSHAWAEFRETLVYPSIGDERQVLYNTDASAAHFSQSQLLGEKLNLRLYNAMPNLLTGGGILGTFVELVAGIYLAGKNLANPELAH